MEVKKYAAVTKLSNNCGGVIHLDTFAELGTTIPDEDWPMLLVCHAEDLPLLMEMLQVVAVEDWATPTPPTA